MSIRTLAASWRSLWVVAGALLASAFASGGKAEASQSQLVADPRVSVPEARFVALVAARRSAIESAFGDFFSASQAVIYIRLVTAKEPDYARAAPAVYDPVQHTLIFRRSVLGALQDELPRWVVAYWPYYESARAQEFFPIVEVVDRALWSAHLQQAAQRSGLTWPHEGCGSIDIAQRLGCEMLVSGIFQFMRSVDEPIFNANRIDRIWPEDVNELKRHAWGRNSREYLEVRRLGGLLLLRPLIGEFGTSRVAAYVAQTPFRIEAGNVRLSALRYQDEARDRLRCAC